MATDSGACLMRDDVPREQEFVVEPELVVRDSTGSADPTLAERRARRRKCQRYREADSQLMASSH